MPDIFSVCLIGASNIGTLFSGELLQGAQGQEDEIPLLWLLRYFLSVLYNIIKIQHNMFFPIFIDRNNIFC
jgi:hypothetical protein